MFTRTILTIALAGFALAPSARADTYSHIDGLAVRLQRYAGLLNREFSDHYRHTPEFGHLISDSRDMSRLAAHVHEVAHVQGPGSHLQSDVRQLDRLFHHLEGLVDRIEHDADFGGGHGHFDDFHGGFGGHIHGETSHVREIMNAMEDTLHHLQSDLRELTAGIGGGYPGNADPQYGDSAFGNPNVNPNFGNQNFGNPSFGNGGPGIINGNNGPIIRFGQPGFSIRWGR